jgi:bla regulator protein BlaR1
MDARLTILPPIAVFQLAGTQICQVTVLAVVVWALVRTIGRNRPHLASVLWLLVLIKCVTPPIVSSPAGVFCWLQPADNRLRAPATSPPEYFIGPLAASPSKVLTHPVADADGDVVVRLSPDSTVLSAEASDLLPDSSATWSTTWLLSLAAAWLAGCLLSTGIFLWRWLSIWRALRYAGEQEFSALQTEFAVLCRELGVRQRVRLLVTPLAVGPAVVGIWRPLIVLPRLLVDGKSPAALRPVLAHELIHIRRGDLWFALLQTLAVLVWWFHPLVRLASRLLSREAERCCDEAVIAHLGCDPAAYARSLLDVLALKQQLRPVPAFPGVRPLDVTSQRLERIMHLRQGCHKRTPWWCWLAMLALAVVVLPGGALLVEAQEKDGEAVIFPAAYQQAGQQPAAPTPAPPWEPKPAANAANDSELSTRVYYVRELLSRLEAEKSFSIAQAKEVLAQLVRSSDSGGWQSEVAKFSESEDDAARLPTLAWADDSLVVRHHSRGHEEIARELKALEKHGFEELAVEVRIISGPAALLKTLPADWRFIGGTAPGEDRAASDAAASVVERQLPAMVGVLEPEGVKALLDAAQANARSNILQAPKVRLFNGQFARIEDTVQRPFVVGVKPVADGVQEPQIRVVSEGMTIRLRPELGADDQVKLQFGLLLSAIESVDIASFAVGAGKDPISVQVPEVATTRIESVVDMKVEETIAIQIPASAKRAKKEQPLCVLVTVRKVADQQREEEIAPPAIQTGREAAGEEAKVVERVYAVADLVIAPPKHPLEIGVVSDTPNAWQKSSAARHEQKLQPKVTADFESLVNLIETTIAPSSWSSQGGEGSIGISASDFSLIIRQSADVHEQIADIVNQLRRLQDVQIVFTAEPIELSQATLDEWSQRNGLAELVKFANGDAQAVVVPAAKWDALPAKPQVERQLPRITALNGQTFDLQLEERGSNSSAVGKLRMQPVATADLKSVRLMIGGLPSADGQDDGATRKAVATNVPTDSLLLVDLEPADGNAAANGNHNRRLCLIRTKILVFDPDTQSLTTRRVK